MGLERIPTEFVDSEAELLSASKFNNDLSHVNFVQVSLVKGGDMEGWTSGTTSAPDNWTLSGTGATVARSADEQHGTYAALLTYGSAAASLYQDALELAALKGCKVKIWAWVKTSTPNIARLRVSDGVGSTSSSYHTGGGTYEFLSVEHDVASAATYCRLELRVEGAGNALFDAAVLVYFDDATGYIPSIYDAAEIGLSLSLMTYDSGALAARSEAPASPQIYYATDIGQRFIYIPAIGSWEAF